MQYSKFNNQNDLTKLHCKSYSRAIENAERERLFLHR